MKAGNLAIFVPHHGCPNRCSFCDQRMISGQQATPSPEQVRNLCRESLHHLGQRAKECEIAFFGGSFTAIDAEVMVGLLEAVQPFLGEDGFGGIRISTRPDYLEKGILCLLKDYGVTAIEIGAQSLVDEVLTCNGRGHTAQAVEDASKRVKDFGFSLGLQMMTGLYGSNEAMDRVTAKEILRLKPDTVRIYPAITLQGTDLAEWYAQGLYTPPSLEETVALVAELMQWFEEAGIVLLKVGLHPSEELNEGYIAGPFHDAFGELCQGKIMADRLERLLSERNIQGGTVMVGVLPRDYSKMVGQKKVNIQTFLKRGIALKIVADATALPMMPKILAVGR